MAPLNGIETFVCTDNKHFQPVYLTKSGIFIANDFPPLTLIMRFKLFSVYETMNYKPRIFKRSKNSIVNEAYKV